ncbi:MetQ/NlpA family ABC transporter substrate-binding protein [Clostridium paraputrificum]|uniref:MetQ/NlpA family ABC transporter substrate-binding protein n=1 Tax=Clostridium paraputrificum TaxID=29363 RepID=UPI003D351818
MKKVKQIVSVLILGVVGFGLVGCGKVNDKKVDVKNITIGVCPGPYGDMITEAIAPQLEAKGYKITIREFTDYIQPDNSLSEKEIDVNLMQHTEYLNKFTADNNLELSPVITVPTLSMGVFSNKYKSLEDLPNKAKIAVPDDVSNLARALRLLKENGLIEIKEGIDETKASLKDISVNKKDIEFVELEGAQLPRSLDSVDVATVPGNFAYASGFDYKEALAIEKLSENYKNIIAVRTADLDTELGKDLKDAVESKEYKDIIEGGKYKEFDKPEWYIKAWK